MFSSTKISKSRVYVYNSYNIDTLYDADNNQNDADHNQNYHHYADDNSYEYIHFHIYIHLHLHLNIHLHFHLNVHLHLNIYVNLYTHNDYTNNNYADDDQVNTISFIIHKPRRIFPQNSDILSGWGMEGVGNQFLKKSRL